MHVILKNRTATNDENNAFHRFYILNMFDVSSIEYNTPPIGDPKVAVIPIAWAAERIWCLKVLFFLDIYSYKFYPIIALRWINGPSLPVDNPDIKIHIKPKHLAKKVCHVSTFLIFNPFNIALSSGIPDPEASYDINLTQANDEITNIMQDIVHTK